MKTILIGYGNVGKAVYEVLQENGISVDLIVRASGIFSWEWIQIDTIDNFDTYVDSHTVAYISIPSDANASKNLPYYLTILERGGLVITCEKSVLAHYWHILKPYKNRLWYSATVWWNSGMLPELHRYAWIIHDIKAVINGTLNVISEESARGTSQEEIFQMVTSQWFAEPGAKNFQEVVDQEMQDVLYKAVIFANHSWLYHGIVTLSDIIREEFREWARCMLVADKHHIRAGFMGSLSPNPSPKERGGDDDTSWFPTWVNNVLLINGQKIVEWPGAWARATALRMYTDGLNAL